MVVYVMTFYMFLFSLSLKVSTSLVYTSFALSAQLNEHQQTKVDGVNEKTAES